LAALGAALRMSLHGLGTAVTAALLPAMGFLPAMALLHSVSLLPAVSLLHAMSLLHSVSLLRAASPAVRGVVRAAIFTALFARIHGKGGGRSEGGVAAAELRGHSESAARRRTHPLLGAVLRGARLRADATETAAKTTVRRSIGAHARPAGA